MSLMNDMLRDLEQQKQVAPEKKGAKLLRAKPKLYRSGTQQPSPKTRLFLPGLAIVAVIYFVVFELNILGLMDESKTPISDQDNQPEPIQVNSTWLDRIAEAEKINAENEAKRHNTSATKAQSDAEQPEPISATEKPLPSNEINKQQTEAKITLALAAIAENRLLKPEQDSAWYYAQQVLTTAPDNGLALDVLNKIGHRYQILFDSAVADKNWTEAQRLVAQASENARYRPLATQLTSVLQDHLLTQINTKSKAAVPKRTPKATKLGDRELAALLASAPTTENIRKANHHVLTQPNQDQTFLTLYHHLFEHQQVAEALALSNALSEINLGQSRLLKARVAAVQGNPLKAIEILESTQISGELQVLSNRLLAGLLQSEKQYQKSAELYAQLVKTKTASVNDWLGLAVSADAMGDQRTALGAYQNTIVLGHPVSDVNAFAQNRLRVLGQTLRQNQGGL